MENILYFTINGQMGQHCPLKYTPLCSKKVLCAKPGGNEVRRRGRPKLRWCFELGNVAQVGCRNWRINVQSREKWQKLIEEVKSHQGI